MARFQLIKDLSIKNKIVTIILFISFTAISIGFTFITLRDINSLKKVTQSHLLLDATIIGDYCSVPLTSGNKQLAFEALSRLKFIESVDEGYLYDRSGGLFATFPDSLKISSNLVLEKKRSSVYKNGYFLITEPIKFEGILIGNLQIKANSKLLVKEIQNLAFVLLLTFLIMLIISYLLALRLQKLLTKPILKLADLTKKISENQDFTQRLEPYGNDEVGFLYHQFNNLLSQLLKKQKERDVAGEEILFLAQALRNINELISITDLENNITFINQSWLKKFGYTDKEVIGKKIDIIVSTANRPGIVDEILSETIKGGWEGEVLNRRKDGSEFTVLLSTSIIFDNENKPVALVGISTDITDRKKAEEAILYEQYLMRSLMDNFPDSIYYKDLNSRFLRLSKNYGERIGLENVNDLIGKSDFDLFSKAHAQSAFDDEQNIIRTGIPLINVEEEESYSDRDSTWVLSTKLPLYDSTGKIIGTFGISKDITDRKKAEEKIHVREQQLSLIYSNVFDAVYYLSLETENRFRFLSVNNTFLTLTGLQESQIINKYVDEIIPEPSLSIVIENYIKAIHEKRTIQWEEISEYPTGKKTGLVSITPLFDSGNKCINLVGTVHDITERKQAEKELMLYRDHLEELVIQRTAELEIEKEHAQSADRLKSAFLATMSHELRTPLNSIIGFTGILMQERPGPLNDEQKKQLGMAQNSARHLLSLINDVLDISKIEAGQLKMNIQQFNLPEVIYKVVETNKPFADKKNLRITVSIDENIKDITSDNLRVQQILLNILNNAIKFTEIGTISITCFSVDNLVKIKIRDSGMGIESDKLEQLFKPFMQVDTGLTRKHEGSGLGLSICKKLTEMLNGKIEVESKYGTGSTFTVTLPMIKT